MRLGQAGLIHLTSSDHKTAIKPRQVVFDDVGKDVELLGVDSGEVHGEDDLFGTEDEANEGALGGASLEAPDEVRIALDETDDLAM